MSIFNSVPDQYKVKVNKFNLSKEILTTGEIGLLYPVLSEIWTPNTFKRITPNVVVKTAPMYAPIYSSMKVDFHCFAVPLRLLWEKFPDWIYNPEDVVNFPPSISELNLKEIIEASKGLQHSLAFDLGVPNADLSNYDEEYVKDCGKRVVIWDWLAYHKIYTEYFRNENIDDEPDMIQEPRLMDYDAFISDNGNDEFINLHHRNYNKDYFTSATPTPQRGIAPMLSVFAENPVLPVNMFASVREGVTIDTRYPYVIASHPQGNAPDYAANLQLHKAIFTDLPDQETTVIQDDNSGLLRGEVDLNSIAQGMSANDFRTLFALTSYLEINMSGGNRYIEGTPSYYGTRVADYRAQRPEFLGVCSSFIHPTQVVAHDQGELGKLGAYGDSIGFGRPFRYYATEHTLIMVLMSVKPRSLYCQGLPKKFRLNDQFDYPIPMFQHVGEEEIKEEELFYSLSEADDLTFGYQSRFAYWRSNYDEIKGDFVTTLKDWHLARIFNQPPDLDSYFIRVDAGTNDYIDQENALNRVFNITSGVDHLWFDIYFDIVGKLPFRYHSKPMLIG